MKKTTVATAGLISSALALSGCGSSGGNSSSGNGGTNGTITIGAIGALSGDAAALGSAVQVIKAYFDQVNANGGINGHKVNVVLGDDQFNAANTPGVARKLVEQNHISLLCGTTGDPDNTAIASYLKARSVPSIPTSGTSKLFYPTSDTQYGFLPTYNKLAAQLVDYAVNDLKKEHIGILYSNDDTGLPALAGVKAELKKLGKPLTASVVYDRSATTLATQAAKLKDAGADFVINWAPPAQFGQFVNDAAKIGYHPAVGGPFFAQSSAFVSAAGKTADNNAYFATSVVGATSPAATQVQTVLDKYYKQGSVDDVSLMEGWTAADTCAAAIRSATANGQAFSASGLQKALNSLTLDDDYVHGLKWTSDYHGGVSEAQITKLSGGKFVTVSDFAQLPDVPNS